MSASSRPLKEHCAAGRLTLDELPDRVARAYAATTIGELAELTYDLPGRGESSSSRRPARRAGRVPGIYPFSETIEFDRPLGEVETQALRLIAPRLARAGFDLVVSDSRNMLLLRTGRLLRTHRVQLTLTPLGDDRMHLRVHGTAPLGIRRAFAELRA